MYFYRGLCLARTSCYSYWDVPGFKYCYITGSNTGSRLPIACMARTFFSYFCIALPVYFLPTFIAESQGFLPKVQATDKTWSHATRDQHCWHVYLSLQYFRCFLQYSFNWSTVYILASNLHNGSCSLLSAINHLCLFTYLLNYHHPYLPIV